MIEAVTLGVVWLHRRLEKGVIELEVRREVVRFSKRAIPTNKIP